jgi:hypothetical protein
MEILGQVSVEINTFALNIAERSDWWFHSDKLKSYITSSGTHVWAHDFPSSFNQLLIDVGAITPH